MVCVKLPSTDVAWVWLLLLVSCGLSLLSVFVLALRSFSLGTLVFPSPQKPTFPNWTLIWIQWRRRATLWMSTANAYLFSIVNFIIFIYNPEFLQFEPNNWSVLLVWYYVKWEVGDRLLIAPDTNLHAFWLIWKLREKWQKRKKYSHFIY